MTYASYRLHRKGWLLWKWIADWRGQATGQGLALSEGSARSAARRWLRAKSKQGESPLFFARADAATDAPAGQTPASVGSDAANREAASKAKSLAAG